MVGRSHIRRTLLAAGLVLPLGLWSTPAAALCRVWNPLGGGGTARALNTEDLVELTGIGRADAEAIGGASPIAISPDQRWAAFIVVRADLDENRHCQALVVIDLEGAAPPRVLDRGGEFITSTVTMRGVSIPNGYPEQIVPQWSPDGRTIAYLRRDQGGTQIWSVDIVDGSAGHVTREPADIASWAWMPGGRIGFATHESRIEQDLAIGIEGQTGWVYDGRVTPNIGFRPQRSAPLPLTFKIADLRTRNVVPALSQDLEWLRRKLGTQTSQVAVAGTARAWTEAITASPLSPRRLRAIDASGTQRRCVVDACTGRFEGLWWGDGRTLLFLRREGWNNRYVALYRWTSGRAAPTQLLRTDDLLERCVQAGKRLLCIRETATRPSHIVAIGVESGRLEVIFDPNPGLGDRIQARVQRILWKNALGFEVYGDLVLPPGHRRGDRLPAIVTLYQSRGFLRGGTGNEYPIYLFAQRGYAVLNIQRPAMFAELSSELATYDQIYAANVRGWSERRNVHSAIADGVAKLVSAGIVDPKRIGITGLSDGATSVRFALINSSLFAAASLSSCCVDETSAVLVGPAWEQYSRSVGYPPAFPVDESFWRPSSLVLNARSISTPLLMQLADSEALYALPSFTALRQHRQPVELRTFPDEFHIKWQPRHRAAIYGTNLDWFDYWLRGRTDPDPAKADQYRRWEELRANAP